MPTGSMATGCSDRSHSWFPTLAHTCTLGCTTNTALHLAQRWGSGGPENHPPQHSAAAPSAHPATIRAHHDCCSKESCGQSHQQPLGQAQRRNSVDETCEMLGREELGLADCAASSAAPGSSNNTWLLPEASPQRSAARPVVAFGFDRAAARLGRLGQPLPRHTAQLGADAHGLQPAAARSPPTPRPMVGTEPCHDDQIAPLPRTVAHAASHSPCRHPSSPENGHPTAATVMPRRSKATEDERRARKRNWMRNKRAQNRRMANDLVVRVDELWRENKLLASTLTRLRHECASLRLQAGDSHVAAAVARDRC